MNNWDTGYFKDAVGYDLQGLLKLSPVRSLGAILVEWSVITASMWIHLTFSHIIVYFVTWLLIGTRLYALYSLLHDCIHFLLLRNKRWNDRIGQILLGFPLFINVEEMRKQHFDHHKFLNTEKDPEMAHLHYKEFQFPKTGFQLFSLYMLDLSGLNFLYYRLLKLRKWLMSNGKLHSFHQEKVILMTYLVLVVASLSFGFWWELLIYWIIPYITIYQLLNRIRLTTEHFNLDSANEFRTRSVQLPWIEKIFLSPHNLGYHTEHHMFPAVPFYNLTKLHKILNKQNVFRENATLDKSYVQVIKKCVK